jgi:cytochrome b subunit of formate dehydrogenase
MYAPFLIILIISGLQKYKNQLSLLVTIGGTLNILVTWAIYAFNIHNLLAIASVIYCILIIILIYSKKFIREAVALP